LAIDPGLLASRTNQRAHRERFADRVPLRGSVEQFVGNPDLLEFFLVEYQGRLTVLEHSGVPPCCASGV
jgi:hypothetical protein